ncbi:MAG: hypothetical protein H6883_09635 [Rhodobiaceae bacterium]|nr:hypothetical protein [Rhodobiaceae bacterium]MCC0056388.1 hypothetical protein [Rhodobiaceae bacterium]
MDFTIAFQPLLPLAILVGAAVLAAIAIVLMLLGKGPAPVLRAFALVLVVLALANPVLRQEERDPLPGVALIVTDTSASQHIDGRDLASEEARAQLEEKLRAIPGLDVRSVEAGDTPDGTQLIPPMEQALSDVPSDRIAAVFMITDGQAHDAAGRSESLGAPVHVLLSGRDGETDRRIRILQQPRFGIVGSQQPITFRVEDLGVAGDAGKQADVVISRDGEALTSRRVLIGQNVTIDVDIAHGGRNLFELAVAPLQGELTELNNRAVIATDGIRENLRVLLVSGAPHAGERTWRNILKSDAAVDLVHFTILRPPDKQDGTPISELALIAFPTRELFSEKIDDFDLIIFDRYARLGVLPRAYFENIAEYVRKGGALLVSSGPEFAGNESLYQTPLAEVLPAAPTGRVAETGFYPQLSEDGKKHPITAQLQGANASPPQWGRWFRTVESRAEVGRVLMSGANGNPLLVTAEAGEGRVALMLSDQAWLWARGFEGGGPYVDLLRRLGHWLMRESALEEEQLHASVSGGSILVERFTMADAPGPVTATTPDGRTFELDLDREADGRWSARISNPSPGIWRFSDGALTAIADAGNINPREFADPRSTREMLEPLAEATGGGMARIGEAGDISLPRIVPVRGAVSSGRDWMGVRESRASILRSTSTYPVLAGLAGLLALLSVVSAMWYRERG